MPVRLPFRACLALLLLVVPRLYAQPMALDHSFAPEVESSMAVVEAMRFVPAPNRELIVLGDVDPGLTHVDDVAVTHRIARLRADGSVDPGFQAQLPDEADVVRGAVALSDGRVLVTTRSETGLQPARIARLLRDGRTDPAFTPIALSGGTANLTLLSDGSVVVWGSFNAIGGVSRNSLARVLPDGSVDAGFAPAITDAALTVVSLVATPTDHVVFSAQSCRQDQPLNFHFNRLTRAGAIDPSFAPPPPGRTFHLIGALSDERLLISRDGLFRLNADGSNDPSYAAQIAPENFLGATVLSGDRLAATIATPTAADGGVSSVFVLGPDGTVELDVRDLAGAERIQSLRGVRSDGALVITQGPLIRTRPPYAHSSPILVPGVHDPHLAIVDVTARTLTTLATRFEAIYPSRVAQLFVDASGGIVVAGNFVRIQGVRRPGLARFRLDRSLDVTFDPVAVRPLFVLPDGRIIGSQTILGAPDAEGFHALGSRVVRLTLEGAIDPTFTPSGDPDLVSASWLTVDAAGRILVAALAGGTGDEHLKLLWLAPDGSVASTLPTTFTRPAWATTTSMIESASLLPDGKLLLRVVGATINGAAPTLLVRLNADGSTDTTYHPSSTFAELRDITTARPLPDGRAYVYGTRAGAGVGDPPAVLRLSPDGAPETLVHTAPAGGIALSDGTYIFENKRYRSDGSQDLNFNLQLGATHHVEYAVLAPDGSLWITGDFGLVMGELRFGLARLVPNDVDGFTLQPQSQRVTGGQTVTFQAEIGTTAPAAFQWTHNGIPVAGATGRTLTLATAHSSDAGEYRVIATVGVQTYASEPATLIVDPSGARLVNFSARSAVAPAHPPQIGGFVLSGPNPHAVLLRAVGSGLPVDNPGFSLLPQPGLTLFRGTTPTASDAGGALAPAIATAGNRLGAAPLRDAGPSGEPARDSALLLTLAPGVYTAQTHSIDGRSGISLFEFYDAAAGDEHPAVANTSIRGRAAPGADVLIAGFVISGNGSLRLLIRGLGPELESRGVHGALTDPQITLYREGTVVAMNDNWNERPDVPAMIALAQRIGAAALPSGSRDAALVIELSAGIYTVHGSATDGASGEMLIELFVDE